MFILNILAHKNLPNVLEDSGLVKRSIILINKFKFRYSAA